MGKKTESNKQAKKFQQAAKDLGCDESEEVFDEKLKKVASAPPPKDTKDKAKNPPK